MPQIAQSLLTLVVVALALTQTAIAAPESRHNRPRKSFIQLIGDGFGPASETFARSFVQARDGLPWDAELPLDKHLVGTIRTRSTDSLVTDSAASATAYSCGVKSVNAYIGVDIEKKPCGTVLEAAKARGYNTALITTSRVTHATPASYSAHISDRDLENEIAAQQLGDYALGRQVDILWGGGLRHFLPQNATGSSREDDRDLVAEARKAGWQIALDRSAFDTLEKGQRVKFPSLGLFTRSHMAYEVDRNHSAEPSLTEMAIAGLNALKKDNKPFFIMIEGARIDHAAHNNDPIGHVHDIIEYNKMFKAVTEWVDNNEPNPHDPEIVVASTADHECGGLALGYQRPEDEEGAYLWYPDVLLKAKKSTEFLSAQFLKWAANKTDTDKSQYMKQTIVMQNLGISDVQDDEVSRALDLAAADSTGLALTIWLSSLVNWRSHLSWSTTGHSGVDVNLYLHTAKGKTPKKLLEKFQSNHENTWIAHYIADHLQLDLAAITKKLNNGTNHIAGQGSANKTTYLDHYHGGVKRVVPVTKAKERRDIGYSHAANEAIFGRRFGPGAHEASHHSAGRRSEL
ncbi:unnamed protein product [Parajaminaea phylloscopi]